MSVLNFSDILDETLIAIGVSFVWCLGFVGASVFSWFATLAFFDVIFLFTTKPSLLVAFFKLVGW